MTYYTRVSTVVVVQCPKTTSNLSNILFSNSVQKAQFCKRSGNTQCRKGHNGDHHCRFRPDNNKVCVNYGNSMIWLCYSEPKLYWHRTKFGNIGPIMPIVSWRVFKALDKVSYWGLIRGIKWKSLLNIKGINNGCPCICGDQRHTGLWFGGRPSEILKVAHCAWALSHNRWTKICDISHILRKVVWFHS